MAETALEKPKRSHPHRKDYTEQEIEAGLHELLLTHGNTQRAALQLSQRGINIPRRTLWEWTARTHAQRYQELRKRVLPQLQAKMAADTEDLASLYAEAERDVVARFRDHLEYLDPKDLSKAAQQFAVSRGISTEKALLLRGQPTSIVETRPAAEILEEALGRARKGSVDSTADEIGDAELVG